MDEVDGVMLIEFERARQLIEKGYDAKHDDAHNDQDLATLGAFLASPDETVMTMQPWVSTAERRIREKHGSDRVTLLAIAGALIAAEIDRLLRQQARASDI